ncbi:MAG: glutathione S-transferase family protein [Pseudomonadales bacterium]
MILLGRDLSPFVRRTATALNLLGLQYERRTLNTNDDAEELRRYNPLGRVPALLVDDAVIIDSAAILDYALELADAEHRLLPASGVPRRNTLHVSAIATGTMEKGVASAYEVANRPKELVYQPYREKLQQQARAGLLALEELAPQEGWFGGDQPNLADVNAVVAYDFVGIVAPQVAESITGLLMKLSQRANALEAFASTRWNGGSPFPK